MKKAIFILLALTVGLAELKAQAAFAPNTGDTEMDGILKDVDAKAKKDLNAFSTNVSTKFNVPKDKIDAVIKIMNPGDIFMSAQVSSITKKPFEEVTKTYQANKEKGWGVIAKELGIKPGSPEFHAMKKAMKGNGNSGGEDHGNGNKGNGHGNSGNGHGHGKK